MRKYQIQICEYVPDAKVMKMRRKDRKQLIDTGDGYSLRVIDMGRFINMGSASLVADLINAFWNRVSDYEYQVDVIEVEEWVGHVLYTPHDRSSVTIPKEGI